MKLRNKNAKVPDPNSFVSNPGDIDRMVYSAKVNDNGVIEVVPTGKENFQEYIESQRSSTDMAYILKQLQLGNGDVLQRSVGQYGDFTQMPKTLAEAMQIQIDAERDFNLLPLDVKAKFNNNFREWLFSFSTPEWIDKMGISQKGDVEPESAPEE